MVDRMEAGFKSDVFGVEKEPGKIEGILAAVYQDVFGGEVYPSLEEKAANLLCFMIKDHPFADGCKRIAASLFLEFLNRNNALFTIIMGLTSAHAKGRIKNIASKNGADSRVLMRIYMMERFLERVSLSAYKDNFIIKGGMLITSMVAGMLGTSSNKLLFDKDELLMLMWC